jgi:hypothetical protein
MKDASLTPDYGNQLDSMLLTLQSARIAFVGYVMQLRYAPEADHSRLLRRALIAFLRLQRLIDAAAAVLDATEAPARAGESAV